MQFSQQQLDQAAKAQLFEKLDRGFCASVPNAALLDRATRFEFFEAAMTEATALGLGTEQGIASYALAAWYLEPGFVDQSRYLRALLASDYPEVRKVHAMNEWVHTLLGQPQDLAGADEALKQAFFRTAPWGTAK